MPEIDVAIREFLRQRAGGHCEYCRITDRLTLAEQQIDHVIAVKHGGSGVVQNLAFCCTVCNRFKGSYIASIDPESGQLTRLFHPRVDGWDEHFRFHDGHIVALSAVGRFTVRLLRMNRTARVRERKLMRRSQS